MLLRFGPGREALPLMRPRTRRNEARSYSGTEVDLQPGLLGVKKHNFMAKPNAVLTFVYRALHCSQL